ncbi:competence protein ComEC, partial [bacterium]|nr:competence protein ComEC [bacterium]
MGKDLKADVLLVPHHGSKTSSTPDFLDAISPRWALLQAGYRNRYGHPAAQVMARYEARAIAVIASVPCGAAHWQSAMPSQVDCERVLQRRYWHHRPP